MNSLPAAAPELKSCCAALYQTDWARLLLGDSFHPGGVALTGRLGAMLGLGQSSTLLDVACGRGASALHLAKTFGCRVIGVDLGAEAVRAAGEAAAAAGLAGLTDFRVADAETLPLPSASVDAVLCECAFCTFPDKGAAAAECARVLRPGGRAALSDLTRADTLPPELQDLLAWVACIAGARPVAEYVTLLEGAGLQVGPVELHDEALTEMVTGIRQRLLGAEVLIKVGAVNAPGLDLERARGMAKAALEAIRTGRLGYALFVAAKPV